MGEGEGGATGDLLGFLLLGKMWVQDNFFFFKKEGERNSRAVVNDKQQLALGLSTGASGSGGSHLGGMPLADCCCSGVWAQHGHASFFKGIWTSRFKCPFQIVPCFFKIFKAFDGIIPTTPSVSWFMISKEKN